MSLPTPLVLVCPGSVTAAVPKGAQAQRRRARQQQGGPAPGCGPALPRSGGCRITAASETGDGVTHWLCLSSTRRRFGGLSGFAVMQTTFGWMPSLVRAGGGRVRDAEQARGDAEEAGRARLHLRACRSQEAASCCQKVTKSGSRGPPSDGAANAGSPDRGWRASKRSGRSCRICWQPHR